MFFSGLGTKAQNVFPYLFIYLCSWIYLMVGSVDQLEPDKILLLLDIMVAASHNKNYSSALKGNRAGSNIFTFT
jgi:hypothetical protein